MTGFNAASISALGGSGQGGQPNGHEWHSPTATADCNAFADFRRGLDHEAEVNGGSTTDDSNQVVLANLPQPLLFVAFEHRKFKTQIGSLMKTVILPCSHIQPRNFCFRYPKSQTCPELAEIENPKFPDDLDPIYTMT